MIREMRRLALLIFLDFLEAVAAALRQGDVEVGSADLLSFS